MKKNNLCKLVKLKFGNVPDNKFNKKQLAMGTKVESEHTNNKCIAKQIAKGHLSEHKDYYIKLRKARL